MLMKLILYYRASRTSRPWNQLRHSALDLFLSVLDPTMSSFDLRNKFTSRQKVGKKKQPNWASKMSVQVAARESPRVQAQGIQWLQAGGTSKAAYAASSQVVMEKMSNHFFSKNFCIPLKHSKTILQFFQERVQIPEMKVKARKNSEILPDSMVHQSHAENVRPLFLSRSAAQWPTFSSATSASSTSILQRHGSKCVAVNEQNLVGTSAVESSKRDASEIHCWSWSFSQ